jgi:hypothetical protein
MTSPKRTSRIAQPKAILRRHGFCHAVWLFDGRTATTIGYFDDTGLGRDVAASINQRLAEHTIRDTGKP